MQTDLSHRSSKTRACFLLILLMAWQGLALAQPVSREDARRAATTFLDNNGASSAELADVSAAAGFDHLYIFTTDHSFVLMAADSRVQPVLGYSFTGCFVVDGMPDNLRAWLQGYNDEIQAAIDSNVKASPKTTRQWRNLVNGVKGTRASVVVAPLLSTTWDQSSPYNMYCPSGTVTGCVATAMAQVMKFWGYPAHGIGSHAYTPKTHPQYGQQYANFNEATYDWSHMTNTYGSSSTTQEKQAVASLMYHCGVSVDMNYGPSSTGGSGAATANVADALKNYFNYAPETEYRLRNSYSNDDWIAMLKADLDLGRPIQYSGQGSGGGHSFVCDGYNDADYFHFNWGWSGNCNEYYTVNNLNPGPGGIGSGAYGVYNNDQGAVFGAHPVQCTANAPSNLTFTLNNRELSLNWSPAEGAASYNIYRDGNYVGNVATTTYSETAPFGTSVYYVRSVDANESLSLSSNEVSVTIAYETPVVADLEAGLTGNNVSLSWTAPEWCYPQTASATLTYGDGSTGQCLGYQGNAHMYWGHRYLPSDLEDASGMVIFKVSCYIREVGAYELQCYQGTTTINYTDASYDVPTTLLKAKTFVASHTGWIDIDLEEPVVIDNTQDLWVMLYDPELKQMPAEYSVFTEHDRGGYYSASITGWTATYSNAAFLIRSYLTDGTYTYNLYRNGVVIASQINDTQYTESHLENGTYTYFVKTNYYGGETEASNTVTVNVPGIITQDVVFHSGWNWWAPTSEITLTQLEAALGSNGILINSQTSGFVRYESGQWTGTLTDIVPGEMYMIRTAADCTFSLEGIAPSSVTVTIHHGHTWFSYPGAQAASIATALGSSFTPMEGDKITSQAENFAIYENGAWTGPLTTLQPGHGYIYMSNDTQNKTITF